MIAAIEKAVAEKKAETGKHLGTLETPERAASLAFGGADRKTLFVGSRSSIYAMATNAGGK